MAMTRVICLFDKISLGETEIYMYRLHFWVFWLEMCRRCVETIRNEDTHVLNTMSVLLVSL